MSVRNKCFAYAALLNWIDPETFTVFKIKVGAMNHYFVKDPVGNIIDPTASQFPFKLDYSKAKRINRFWGKRLPRQSRLLLRRIRNE